MSKVIHAPIPEDQVHSLIDYLGCPSNIGHKYRLDHLSRALSQILSHWRAFLTQTGRGEIGAIVGDHLGINVYRSNPNATILLNVSAHTESKELLNILLFLRVICEVVSKIAV